MTPEQMRSITADTILRAGPTRRDAGEYVSLPWNDADFLAADPAMEDGYIAIRAAFDELDVEKLVRFADNLAAEPAEIGILTVEIPWFDPVGSPVDTAREIYRWYHDDASWLQQRAIRSFTPWFSENVPRVRRVALRGTIAAMMLTPRFADTWLVLTFPPSLVEWDQP